MFYSQVILAKKGPLAKVWLAAHWGDKKLARPQIFATDIAKSVDTIVNPTMPLALRMSGYLLLGVVRIYSRKVKYVLNDCTEAMLKLQMAFHPQSAKGKELLEGSGGGSGSGGGNQTVVVTNFGDYDQVHVVEGFCLPLPDQNEWILAEDDEEGGEGQGMPSSTLQQQQQQGGMEFSPPTTAATPSPASPIDPRHPPQEETWVPFDPENEEDEEEQGGGSRVSEVEVVRAAGDSFLSADDTRRASSVMDKSQEGVRLGGGGGGEGGDISMILPEEEEEDNAIPMPFDDDEEEEEGARVAGTPTAANDSLLQLSVTEGVNVSAISGLEMEGEEQENVAKRAIPPPPRQRRRKRRKVIIDNDSTELSNAHIKDMLADTSDIVRRQPHPAYATQPPEQDVAVAIAGTDTDIRTTSSGGPFQVPSLTRPFLADDGHLHPILMQAWQDSFYRALDKPCPFERRPEDEEEVEVVRRQASNPPNDDDEEEEDGSRSEFDLPPGQNEEEEEEDQPTRLDAPNVTDEMEEMGSPGVPVPFDQEEEEEEEAQQALHAEGLGDLGLVNELQWESEGDGSESEDEETREAVGEHTGTKWHKHTVKVLRLLQSRLRPLDTEEEEEEVDETKAASLEFGDLVKNVTRRTAASCFMECLQLKTWDFVELEQTEAYGAITVSAGPRFTEAPPNKV